MNKKHKNKVVVTSFFIILLCLGLNFCGEKQTGTKKESPAEGIKGETNGMVLHSEDYPQAIQEAAIVAKKKEKKQFWHDVKVEVGREYEKAYIVLFYTDVENTPEEALAYSPDFTRFYSAVAMNENQEGEIIFELDSLEEGEWTVLVLNEKYMGTYLPYVIEKIEYEKVKAGGDAEREVPY